MNPKGFVPIIALLVILSFTAIGGVIYYLNHQSGQGMSTKLSPSPRSTFLSVPNNQASASSDLKNLNGWKTYNNQDSNYSFQLPFNWSVVKSLDSNTLDIDDETGQRIVTITKVAYKNQNIIDCSTGKSFQACDFITVQNGQVVINWTTNPGPGSFAVGPAIAEAIKGDQNIIEFDFNYESDPIDAIMKKLLKSFKFTSSPGSDNSQVPSNNELNSTDIVNQKIAACDAVFNRTETMQDGSYQLVPGTDREFLVLPSDIYSYDKVKIQGSEATAGYISNGGPYPPSIQNNCWSLYYEFDTKLPRGLGSVDIIVPSNNKMYPDFRAHFSVGTDWSS